MSEELRSILLGTSGLAVAGLVALFLTVSRGGVVAGTTSVQPAVRIILLAVLFQAAHFGEEVATGFHQRFPELLGLTPWSLRFFVSFNLAWLAVWAVAAWGLALRWWAALFPLWFLGIGCAANGLAHPAFALRVGGYFPGLFTSPLVGILGVLVLRQLYAVTGERQPSLGAV
jgi:hypothetical protein